MLDDVYYNPEKFGLTIIGDVDTAGSYEFYMLAVWQRDEDGALFWQTDSGCSCPSPFEDVYSVEGLNPITDAAAFAAEARKWLREQYKPGANDRDAVERLIRKVRERERKSL
jgi:hypothetical protein